ncbi:DNA recombination protein RmuC [mine drainage metagenome]|uniref:DNA recombination protein RmuC n=1 Tax=mine drainage metagenome TaxID=410659 RepID=A0A1J5SCT7_9ZZZZ
MDLLLIVLCSAGAAALAWFVARSRQAVLAERLRATQGDLVRVTTEGDTVRREAETLRSEKSALQAELAAERASAEARLAELRSAHDRLKAEFAELSAAALRSSRDDFLKLATQAFGQLREASASDLEARQASITALVQPLKESLSKVDGKIADLERARATAYGQLGQQLESLHTAHLRLQAETSRLATALSTTRTAGTWGEVQLRRVVELAGLVEHCDFAEQVTPGGGERDRADLVIYLPGNQQIVVDAKAPTEAFREAAVETDPVRRAAKLAEHAAKVRGHADALGAREYWAKFQPSPEFVILFLPGDQFLSAALEGDPSIMDRALAKKVLLATPATLIALLKAAAYGWRQEAVSKNAEEISALGRQLYDRFAIFAEHLDRVGRGLEAAVTHFNKAVGSFESSLVPGGRRFAELGAQGTKEIKAPEGIEAAPREVAKKA